MLNITTRISISTKSKGIIRQLKVGQDGVFTSASWNAIRNSVKNEISRKLFANQGLKCVYCERDLVGLGHEIDHFAHKGDYPQFAFIPINLFYSCRLCNSPDRKGQKNTIVIIMNNYNECSFSIVHPFIHNPNEEIVFSDPDRIYFDLMNCSQLGIDTINFFGWNDLLYTTIRSKILVNERSNPLSTQDERQLIQAAISYKKK